MFLMTLCAPPRRPPHPVRGAPSSNANAARCNVSRFGSHPAQGQVNSKSSVV
jgi:hypothetical protein